MHKIIKENDNLKKVLTQMIHDIPSEVHKILPSDMPNLDQYSVINGVYNEVIMHILAEIKNLNTRINGDFDNEEYIRPNIFEG